MKRFKNLVIGGIQTTVFNLICTPCCCLLPLSWQYAGYFLLHKNMLQMLILPWLRSWIAGPDLLTAFLGSCVALAGSILLCAVIERVCAATAGAIPQISVIGVSDEKETA